MVEDNGNRPRDKISNQVLKKKDKTTIVNDDSEKESSTEHEERDKLTVTKSIVIRKAELMAKQYGAWYLRVLFLFSAFVCSFGYSLDSNIRSIYMSYAMSNYESHPLVSTVGVISEVISAVSQLFFAGLSDVFGRLSLFIVSILFYVVGTVLQSQASNVQKYAAGTFFYNVGLVGGMLQVVLILSDNSSLKWRLLYTFVPAWPAIITTWVSGNVVSAANPEKHWSWSIGMWAFIFPLSALPLIGCMLHMRWKVRNDPEWKDLQKQESLYQSHGLLKTLVQLFWKLDVVGLVLLTVGVGCICVPLTVAGGVNSSWRNPKIIAPLVLGVVLVPIFIYWETKLALMPFAPFRLLKDRGVWAPLVLLFLDCFVYAMPAGYLYTILIVSINQTDLSATRISSLYSFVTAVISPFLGFLVAKSSRLKPYIVIGAGLYFVTMGLFYHYRSGEDSASGIIGAMVVWGICSSLFDYPINVSIQTVTSHENMASVTALGYTIFNIGGAVGSSVSGAIWTQLLYPKLHELMGDASLAESAYNSPFEFIGDHAWGTPIRNSMVEAYKSVQKYEVLVGLVFVAPMFIISFLVRDPHLTNDVGQDLDEGEYVEATQDDPISDWFCRWFPKLSKTE